MYKDSAVRSLVAPGSKSDASQWKSRKLHVRARVYVTSPHTSVRRSNVTETSLKPRKGLPYTPRSSKKQVAGCHLATHRESLRGDRHTATAGEAMSEF